MTPNEKAFLDMLAYTEGTQQIGDRGYDALVGGGTFDGYAHHPNKMVALKRSGGKPPIYSDAAGRYQFLFETWKLLKERLQLPDFSPDSQDAACLELVREHGALELVQAGRIPSAILACNKIWASLPGSPYGQGGKTLDEALHAYQLAGGQLA